MRSFVKCVRQNYREKVISKKNTWTRVIFLISLCLQYIVTFSNFEKKVKPITLLKYDNYSTISAYRLATAFCTTIDSKTDGKIKIYGGMGTKERDTCQEIAATSPEDVNICNHMFMDMLTPSTSEILRAFTIHFNYVTFKTYEEEKEETLKFMDKVGDKGCVGSPAEISGGHLKRSSTMDGDLEL